MPTSVPVARLNLGADMLQKALDAAVGVPEGKRGYLDLGATTSGAQVILGQKFAKGRLTGNVGVWGGMEWTGMVSAGVRLRAAW